LFAGRKGEERGLLSHCFIESFVLYNFLFGFRNRLVKLGDLQKERPPEMMGWANADPGRLAPPLPWIAHGCKKSFQFAAFLRGLFLILCAAIYSCILGTPALIICLLAPFSRWSFAFQRIWANWLLQTNGIRVSVRGLENLEKSRSYILLSNHTSLLDIPGIISAFPFQVRFIAKKSLAWIPIFGWSLHLSGHILIDRKRAQSAMKSSKKAASLLKSGVSIIAFPEGTRSPDGQVKEFKGGTFLLALESRAPIVPVSISGTYQMLPRSGWCFWPGSIQIHLGQPIPTQGIPLSEARLFMKRVRDAIIQNLN
jgi:1-acyl-sn-glycerol-3-phosphate acyltransferase